MKALILTAVLALGFSAHAKTYTVKNDEAQRLVEAIIYTQYWFAPVDANTKRLVTMGPSNCTVTKNDDGIEGAVHCYEGYPTGTGTNEHTMGSLAFYQVIRKYAKPSLYIGMQSMAVDKISCDMRIQPRKYTCTITVD